MRLGYLTCGNVSKETDWARYTPLQQCRTKASRTNGYAAFASALVALGKLIGFLNMHEH